MFDVIASLYNCSSPNHYVYEFVTIYLITFGSQMFSGRTHYFKDAYEKAISVSYRFLLVDMHPATEDKYRLRTEILTNEDTVVHEPKISAKDAYWSLHLSRHVSCDKITFFFFELLCRTNSKQRRALVRTISKGHFVESIGTCIEGHFL